MLRLPAVVHPTSDEAIRLSTGWSAVLIATVVLLANAFVTRADLFLDQAVGGLFFGLILVLIALGLAIILGLLGIVNFAHGALFMLGAYGAYQLMEASGLPFPVAFLGVPIAIGVVGIVIERGVLRFLYDENPLVGLLATFGIALMLTELTEGIWGGSPQSIDTPGFFEASINLGVTTIPGFRLFIVAVCILAVLAVYLLIERTTFGLSIRAGVLDREMAEFLGINIPLRFTLMFFLGSALAGLGGLLYGTELTLDTGMGDQFIIIAFVVVVVGGVGSLFGSVFAGLLIGWARFLTPLTLETFLIRVEQFGEATQLVDVVHDLVPVTILWGSNMVPDLGGLMPYLVMIVVLLVRPRGLFGREGYME